MGNQEAGEGEGCALLGIPFPLEQSLSFQLRRHQRRDRQRHTAVLIEAVDNTLVAARSRGS